MYIRNTIRLWLLYLAMIPSQFILCQSNLLSFIDRYLAKRDHHESLTLTVFCENKFYGRDDTMRRTAEVEIVRKPDDTIYGGLIYIKCDTAEYAYDGSRVMVGDLPSSTLTILEASRFPGESIKYDWPERFVEYSFLTRNQGARMAIQNPNIKTTVVDTMIGRWPCKGIRMEIPDQEEFTKQYVFVAIDTIDLMLRKRVTSSTFQENEQYESWTYLDIAYGHQTSIPKLSDSFMNTYQHQKEYERGESDTTTLSTIDYSILEGKLMNKDEFISLRNIKARIILLDFWYSSCYPCIKSIPEVNKIYDNFHDEGVEVFGVNIIDDEAANKSRMEKYVRNNPMKYETIMANRALYSSWVPLGYPTLLVLDGDYNLIKMHTGYNEHMADEIAKVIEDALND